MTTIEALCRELTEELAVAMHENQIRVVIDFETQITATDKKTLVEFLLKTRASKDLGPQILCAFNTHLILKYPWLQFELSGCPIQNGDYEITLHMPANPKLSNNGISKEEQNLLKNLEDLLKQGMIKTIYSYRPNALFQVSADSITTGATTNFVFSINYKEPNIIFWSAIHEQFSAFVAQKFTRFSVRGYLGKNNEFIFEVLIPTGNIT